MNTLARLKDMKLYFTVTSGRSGTAFLADYIGKLGHTCSMHEPVPQFHPHMRQALYDRDLARAFWIHQKAPTIVAMGVRSYVETTHLLCKGFLEPLFEEGIYPNLILLKRRNRDVAKSLYYLNTIPGRTEAGLKYYLKPDDPGVLHPVRDWQLLSDYQLCYWYTLEIEARQHHYASLVRSHGARVLEVHFHDLVKGKMYHSLIDFLDLPQPSWIKRWIMKISSLKKVNAKTRRKLRKSLTAHVDFENEEQKLFELLNA
jgi:hypothetical protein